MTIRNWRLTLDRHEENLSGLRCGSEQELFWGWQMAPTTKMVQDTIRLFAPEYVPDERWMTVAEQIRDGLEYGHFSVSLRRRDRQDVEFETYSFGFMEV